MAVSFPITPLVAFEVPHAHTHAHTAVSRAFRTMLRSAEHAVTAEHELEFAGGVTFDPALSRFQTEADEAWTTLDAAIETVLTTPHRRAADQAIKRITQVYQLCLSLTDYADLHALHDRYTRHNALFRVKGHTPPDSMVNALIAEADATLLSLFALERFGAIAQFFDDDPDPTSSESDRGLAA